MKIITESVDNSLSNTVFPRFYRNKDIQKGIELIKNRI